MPIGPFFDECRIAAANGRFSRIRQVAPMCTPYIEAKNGCHDNIPYYIRLTAFFPG